VKTLTAKELAGMPESDRIAYERRRISRTLRREALRYIRQNECDLQSVYRYLKENFIPVTERLLCKWFSRQIVRDNREPGLEPIVESADVSRLSCRLTG